MKTVTQLKTRPKENSFIALLREAMDVTRELKKYDIVENNKMSAKAFVRVAIARARTNWQKLVNLRAELDHSDFRAAAGMLRVIIKFIRSGNCTAPPKQPSRLNMFATLDGMDQLPLLKASLYELFALAAMIASEKYPEAFGAIEDMDAHQDRLTELRESQANLFKRIETEYTAEDIQLADTNDMMKREGFIRATFKISNGEVPLGQGCGEKLIAWLIAHNVEL